MVTRPEGHVRKNWKNVAARPWAGNSLQCLQSGDEYFADISKAIEEARIFIHIQVYIWNLDTTGVLILEKCLQAAMRGVKVFILLDKYGSQDFTTQKLAHIKAGGIVIQRFSTYLNTRKIQIGRTLHTKAIVIDGMTGWVGGINIADRYSGYDGTKPFLDFALKLKGPVLYQLQIELNKYWRRKYRIRLNEYIEPARQEGPFHATVCVNDYIRGRNDITRHYEREIEKSAKRLLIVSGYFYPIMSLRRRLYEAAERGVEITLLLPGPSDIAVFKKASRAVYYKFLRKGMKIHELSERMLHAKIAIADEHWLTVGSYNLNQLSDYGSVEMNVTVYSGDFIEERARELQEIIRNSATEINLESMQNRGIMMRITDNLCLLMVRTLLRMLYLINKR